MNALNRLENRLRGWQPRPPSTRLKDELFGTHDARRRPSPAWHLPAVLRQWTPVVVGLAMTALLCCHRGAEGLPLATGSTAGPLLAAAFSNQFYAAYLPDLDHSSHNPTSPLRMRWTNGGTPPSTIRFFAAPRTNQTGTTP